ncbi:MAG: InlB B-repeat-containing protein [Clostridia bacterium]|nr:InlB B-repeat-containing protein [Clostridia bacterium]
MKLKTIAFLLCFVLLLSVFAPAMIAADAGTITFDANGGYFDGQKSVTVKKVPLDEEGYPTDQPDAEREGWIFNGWRTEPDGGTEIWNIEKFTPDMTFYAAWSGIIPVATPDEFKTNYAEVPGEQHPAVTLTADMTVDFVCSSWGNVFVPGDVTLTIGDGGLVEGAVENKGTILVKKGGILATTMGGNIDNFGIIIVEEGGTVRSQMGGNLVNKAEGSITLNGVFDCGAFDGPWFRNEGKIDGTGKIKVRVLSPSDDDHPGKEAVYEQTKAMIGDAEVDVSVEDQVDYMISFDTDGGNEIDPVMDDRIPSELPVPTKDGSVFAGWYTDKELTDPAESSVPIDREVTLYAKWAEPEPFCAFVKGAEATQYKDGETLTLNPGDKVLIGFEGNTYNGQLIVGWNSGALNDSGLICAEAPVFENDHSYLDLTVPEDFAGKTADLQYYTVLASDVFGENAVGWVGAKHLTDCVVHITVPASGAVATMPGDVDLDGKVLANDARLALRYSAKLETNLTPEQIANAAVIEKDGKTVTAADARKILRYSASLEKSF